MDVRVEVAGGPTETRSVPEDATYGDLVADLDVTCQEVAILVDGRPRPADAPIEADRVRIVRLIKGG